MKAGFFVIEVNKGDKIVWKSGQSETIDRHGVVIFMEDWEKWLKQQEENWKFDKYQEELFMKKKK